MKTLHLHSHVVMDGHPIFDNVSCYIHQAGYSNTEILAMECCLQDKGATILLQVDTIQSLDALEIPDHITHVICAPNSYKFFMPALYKRFFHIVRLEWIFRSYLLEKKLSELSFSANPQRIFASLAFVPNKLDNDTRKVIYTLIKYYGGIIIEDKDMCAIATHYLTFKHTDKNDRGMQSMACFGDIDDEKSILIELKTWKNNLQMEKCNVATPIPSSESVNAYLGKLALLDKQYVVSHSWLEQCVRKKVKIAEESFERECFGGRTKTYKAIESNGVSKRQLHESASVYENPLNLSALLDDNIWSQRRQFISSSLESNSSASPACFHDGAIALLAQHITPELRAKAAERLKNIGVKVAIVPTGSAYQTIVRRVASKATFIICQYESGYEYEEALRLKKQIISVIWILYGHMLDIEFFDILAEPEEKLCRCIFRPLKSPVALIGMHGLVITISGYTNHTSPTRKTVQLAIQMSGACMLPALSRTHSTHLLCYEPEGEKYIRAVSWNFKYIVNHEWLFDCLSKARVVPETAYLWGKERSNNCLSPALKVASILEKEDTHEAKEAKESEIVFPNKVSSAYSKSEVAEIEHEPEENIIPFANNSSMTSQDVKVNVSREILFNTPSVGGKKRHRSVDNYADIARDASYPSKAGGEEADHHAVMDVKAKKLKTRAVATRQKKRSNKHEDTDNGLISVPYLREKKISKTRISDDVCSNKRRTNTQKSEFRFLLTATSDKTVSDVITSLGGIICESGRQFDDDCTHIICSELKRTEKFVAGCAAGKWILKPSYLIESTNVGHFVDEVDHEWGTSSDLESHIDNRIWPCAPRHWRVRRQAGHPGPYEGWRFIIHPDCIPPPEMCEKIIVAGKGTSILVQSNMDDIEELAQEHTDQRPVLVLAANDVSVRDTKLKYFISHNFTCVKAGFLLDYITKDPAESVHYNKYIIHDDPLSR